MTQYIDKSAVVAEIQRRKELVSDPILSGNDLMIGERNALFNLLSFIDTLEVKEVDLKKEMSEYFVEHSDEFFSDKYKLFAKHFFELGLYSQLSWQDVKRLAEIGESFMNSEESDNLSEEEYYTEILNKFKAQKEE